MAIFSGALIMVIGYFTPFLSFGSILFAIGAGLVYSLDIGSSAAKYLGYQAILGIGQGLAIQVPVIVCQAFSEPADIPAVTAMVLCKHTYCHQPLHDLQSYRCLRPTILKSDVLSPVFQMIGGAMFVSAAQCIFSNRLLQALSIHASEIDREHVLAVGASELRGSFSSTELPGILESYMVGLKGAFALGVALAVTAVIASFGPPVKTIKGKVKVGATGPT